MPKTDPECFGARSKALTVVPKLWKLLANKASVQSAKAAQKLCTKPKIIQNWVFK
jgi:hypothetical protein